MSYLKMLSKRTLLRLCRCTNGHQLIALKTKTTSTTASSGEGVTDEPLKFFGSNAATWKAREGFSGGAEKALWYQPYVISGTLAIFLMYFCMLREENDIDRKLSGSLFDHVEGMEEVQLNVIYKYNLEHGLPVADIERRMAEVQAEKYQNQINQNEAKKL